MKRILLFLLAIIFSTFNITLAQTTYYSNGDGYWDVSSTWTPNGVPGAQDTVIIHNGDHVTIDPGLGGGTYDVAKLKVLDSARLTIYNGRQFLWWTNLTYLNIYDTLQVDGIIEGDVNSQYPVHVYIYKSMKGTGTIKFIGFVTSASKITIEPKSSLTLYISFIYIDNNDTIENYGNIFVDRWIDGGNTNSTWINKANSFLSIGRTLLNTGTLICNETGNTIKYAPIYGDVNIKIPKDSIYYNLYIEGSDTTFLNASKVYINNDFFILGSTFNAQTNQMYIRGNWSDNGEFKCDNCTVTFDGTKDQTISASAYETFENLVVNNSPHKLILNSDIVVNDTLTLNSVINGNGHTVTIGQNLSNIGTLIYQSGKIIGKVKRWVTASANSYLYPIGTDNFYTFVNVTFPGLASGGIASFQFIDTMPGSNGLPLKDGQGDTAVNPFNDGYWIADTSNGFSLGANTYSISLQGKVFNAFTIHDSTKIIVRPHQDSLWRFDGKQGTNDPASYYVARTALDTFPWQFALADTTHCSPPTLTAINGPADVCRGDAGIEYSTDTSSTNLYFWSVTGGTITQNNGDTITIDWQDDGQFATISVYAQNSCSFGNTIKKTVKVHSIPPDVIYGPRSVPVGADSVLYYIDKLPNYSYSGSVLGNAVIDSITPDMDSAWISFPKVGNDTILTIAKYNGGCAADTAAFSVYVYDVINSVQSGDWYDPSTWDCNCQPLNTDNVRINPGHTVLVNQYTDTRRNITYDWYDINNVIVEKGGILTHDNGIILNIHGDIINNGVIDYKYQNLQLYGTDKTIDGLGVFSVDTIELKNSRIISTNANLTVNGSFQLNNNMLNNQGKLIVSNDIKASTGTFVNGKNAILSIKGSLLPSGGELIADSTNNTISYIGADQSITPVSTSSKGYYNLLLGGNGTKTAAADLSVLGDFIITDTASFDIQNHNITLYGDWYEYSIAADPFIEGTSLVLFNASGDQHIYAENGETFYDLKVGQNSILHATPNQHFTITNNFYIDGLLKLEMNNYNDTLPSLIYNNDIIYGTNGAVETDLMINKNQWHEISPAITGLNSGQFTRLNNGTFDANLYWYDESIDLNNDPSTPPADPFDNTYLSQGWKYAHNGTSGADVPLNLNGGYLYYIDRDTTFQMKGTVAKVSVNYDTLLSYNANDPISDTLPNFYDGWNLIGNPYTAYLSIDSVLKNSVNVDNGVFVWDDAKGQYAGYKNGYSIMAGTLGNLIPPLQAFFIRANAAGAIAKIRPEYRTHGKQQYLKNSVTSVYKLNAIKLGFSTDIGTEYFAAYFYPQAKTGYDSKFDLIHLSSNDPARPQLYGEKNSIKLALLALPDSLMGNTVIPLYVQTSLSGTHKLSVQFVNGMNNNFVLLRDHKTGQVYDLRHTKNIEFQYTAGEDTHRFDLMIIRDNPPVVKDSIPALIAYEDSTFSFVLNGYFADNDMFDTIILKASNLPEWLHFDGHRLYGKPAQEDVGQTSITVEAYDIFSQKASQSVHLQVINTNDPPMVNYTLDEITTMANDRFIYAIPHDLFTDPDPQDKLTISASNLPQWLSFDSQTLMFTGIPTTNDAGIYKITLTATDQAGEHTSTTVTIKVETKSQLNGKAVNIYPVPASQDLNILLATPTDNDVIKIYTTNGKLIKQIRATDDLTHLDITDLQAGQYIIEIQNGGHTYKLKFTKI